jgi:hypothetical protein
MFTRLFVVTAVLSALGLAAGPCPAGAVKGPRRWSRKVEADGKAVYHIAFRGGEIAEFAIVGDGGTDVDLFVYNRDGRLVVSDTGLSDLGLVRWRPAEDQVYRVELVNLGRVPNTVRCGHN